MPLPLCGDNRVSVGGIEPDVGACEVAGLYFSALQNDVSEPLWIIENISSNNQREAERDVIRFSVALKAAWMLGVVWLMKRIKPEGFFELSAG